MGNYKQLREYMDNTTEKIRDRNRLNWHKHKDKYLAQKKEYRNTEAYKLSQKKAKDKYWDQNPEKRKAHRIVSKLIRQGTLIKPDRCPICGVAGTIIEGHHEDYNRPAEVTWSCRQCHADIHSSGHRSSELC